MAVQIGVRGVRRDEGEAGVLTAMVHVDLNPIRDGVANSAHGAFKRGMRSSVPLTPLVSTDDGS
ncbi:MAG TPA: hypothetical protein VNA21_14150 [Steroidobacteraceae bacterium]|nr:hypothetical protein [Steroidobacteraceae bacterium]